MTIRAVGVDRGQFVSRRQSDDQIAMNVRQRAPRNNQAAIRGACEGRHGALNLARVAHVDRDHLHPERLALQSGWRRTGRSRQLRWDHAGLPLRVTPGAICLSSSSHFALRPYSKFVNPVALPPGRARLSTKPPPTGSTHLHKHDWHGAGHL